MTANNKKAVVLVGVAAALLWYLNRSARAGEMVYVDDASTLKRGWQKTVPGYVGGELYA